MSFSSILVGFHDYYYLHFCGVNGRKLEFTNNVVLILFGRITYEHVEEGNCIRSRLRKWLYHLRTYWDILTKFLNMCEQGEVLNDYLSLCDIASSLVGVLGVSCLPAHPFPCMIAPINLLMQYCLCLKGQR